MTIINNGSQPTLVVPSIGFSGPCGFGRGVLAFTPAAPIGKPSAAYAATIGDRPVVLVNMRLDENGRSYTAQVLG